MDENETVGLDVLAATKGKKTQTVLYDSSICPYASDVHTYINTQGSPLPAFTDSFQ